MNLPRLLNGFLVAVLVCIAGLGDSKRNAGWSDAYYQGGHVGRNLSPDP
jgi:hypothetical protein